MCVCACVYVCVCVCVGGGRKAGVIISSRHHLQCQWCVGGRSRQTLVGTGAKGRAHAVTRIELRVSVCYKKARPSGAGVTCGYLPNTERRLAALTPVVILTRKTPGTPRVSVCAHPPLLPSPTLSLSLTPPPPVGHRYAQHNTCCLLRYTSLCNPPPPCLCSASFAVFGFVWAGIPNPRLPLAPAPHAAQDFSEDTYRTLAAADNAVLLVDGAKGIEPQTRKASGGGWGGVERAGSNERVMGCGRDRRRGDGRRCGGSGDAGSGGPLSSEQGGV